MSRLRVFLCHSRADKPTVRALHERLARDGFAPWLDEVDLMPGQDWDLEIQRAIRASHVVLVCVSADAVTRRGYVQKEIRIVLDEADRQPEDTIFVVPARLEDCDVPERLSRWQWVDLFVDEGYQKLRRALEHRASVEPEVEPPGTEPELAHSRPATHPTADAEDPDVRLDGLYVQGHPEYNMFIRFFAGGDVVAVSSPGTVDEVATWMHPETNHLSKGAFTLHRGFISFDATSPSGTVEYRGTVSGDAMELHLHSRSLINGYESYGVWRFARVR